MFQRSNEGESCIDVTRKILLLGQKEIVFWSKALLTPEIFIFQAFPNMYFMYCTERVISKTRIIVLC